jgi:serine/threonine protein kinase
MQFFRQDDNFEMTMTPKDKEWDHTVDGLNLCWDADANEFDQSVLDSMNKRQLKMHRHLKVDRSFILNKKPTYKTLIQPFFSDYLENYVERQDHKYDELIKLVRKLLKVEYSKRTSLKELIENDKGIFQLTCAEIKRDKKPWSYSKHIYTLTLRYYEFYLTGNDCDDCDDCENCEECNDCGIKCDINVDCTPECPCPCANRLENEDEDDFESSSSYEIKKDKGNSVVEHVDHVDHVEVIGGVIDLNE